MNYATDGKCHNANPGTWGHECGKAAAWTGMTSTGFRSGFCDHCKQQGHEAEIIDPELVPGLRSKATKFNRHTSTD
jgi:hypothetical protein